MNSMLMEENIHTFVMNSACRSSQKLQTVLGLCYTKQIIISSAALFLNTEKRVGKKVHVCVTKGGRQSNLAQIQECRC